MGYKPIMYLEVDDKISFLLPTTMTDRRSIQMYRVKVQFQALSMLVFFYANFDIHIQNA